MPSKKSHGKGKKSVPKAESKNQEIPEKENVEEEKATLKVAKWDQDDNSLDMYVYLFAGMKLKGNDVDVTFTDHTCDVKLIDGRKWHTEFFKPIDMNSSRVQLKGFRIILKIKKTTPGEWPCLQYIPSQTEVNTQTPQKKNTVLIEPATKVQNEAIDKTTPSSKLKSETCPVSSVKENDIKEEKCIVDHMKDGGIASNASVLQDSSNKIPHTESNKGDQDRSGSTNQEALGITNQKALGITNQEALGITNQEALGITNQEALGITNQEALGITNQEALGITNQEALDNIITMETKPDVTDLLETENKDPSSNTSNCDEKAEENCAKEEDVYNLLHVKNDFFEKTVAKPNDTVSVQIFVKGIIKDTLNVQFEGKNVSVKFSTINPAFLSMYKGSNEQTIFGWKIEVVDTLLESQCKHRLTSTSLELTLRKKEPRRWCALEAVHTKGKVTTSSEWLPASTSTTKVEPNKTTPPKPTTTQSNVIFDEMENDKTRANEISENKKNAAASSSKGHVLGDSTKDNVKKPTCMVSPLKPPKEKQVVPPGYTGLDNLGNTCFMNSVLQVLSNTTELRDYFLDGHFQKEINMDNPLGSGGKLAIEFAMLLKVLWSGTKYSYAPTNLKKLVAQKKSMFMGFAQHDAQEYMSFLLDGLHEDVNKVKKKPYIEQVDSDGRPDEEVAGHSWENHKKRNDSFLVDLFQGQYKSTLVCPVCDKVSVTFDPFMHLPVPLPKKQRLLPVIFVSRDPRRTPVKYMLRIPRDASVDLLKDSIFQKTNIEPKNLRVFEAYHNKVQAFFNKGDTLNRVQSHDKIIVHEVLSEKLAGEPVKEIVVTQRLFVPLNRPGRCAFCHQDEKPDGKLQRCTGCFRVGYCKTECQRQHWKNHKDLCRKVHDAVGMPCIISLPQSQTTFSRISQMADLYSRYSVDVFQPPQDNQTSQLTSPETNSYPDNTASTSQSEKVSDLRDNNSVTSDYNSSSSLFSGSNSNDSSKNFSEGASCSATSVGEDSGQGSSSTLFVETDDNSVSQNNTMTSSVTSSQDTESSAGDAGDNGEPISVSTSSTSLSSYTEDTPQAEGKQDDQSSGDKDNTPESADNQQSTVQETATKNTPTRIVMGRQQDPEKPPPQFNLKPANRDGSSLKERLKDRGEEPLDLEGIHSLNMEWKNWEKERPFVQVQTKEYIFEEDPSMHTVLLEENKNITLQQCLSLFTEPEILSSQEAWYCPKCKEHREASKQLSLWRLPNTLIIQLKRFSYRNLLWCDKVEKIVEFPLTELDMSPFYVGKMPESEPPPIYDLYGVVNHYGGIMGGHYTAYTRCVSAKDPSRNELGWRSCDDSHVSNTSDHQVITRAAYVLFYRRRDMNVKLPSSISSSEEEHTEEKSSMSKSNVDSNISINEGDMENNDDRSRPIFTIASDQDEDNELPRPSQHMDGMLDYGAKCRPRGHNFTCGGSADYKVTSTQSEYNNKDVNNDAMTVSYSDMDSVD